MLPKMHCVQWKNAGWLQCLQAQLMPETAHVVCNSIVEYTEQAGVVVWRKITAWPFEYTTIISIKSTLPSSNT